MSSTCGVFQEAAPSRWVFGVFADWSSWGQWTVDSLIFGRFHESAAAELLEPAAAVFWPSSGKGLFHACPGASSFKLGFFQSMARSDRGQWTEALGHNDAAALFYLALALLFSSLAPAPYF